MDFRLRFYYCSTSTPGRRQSAAGCRQLHRKRRFLRLLFFCFSACFEFRRHVARTRRTCARPNNNTFSAIFAVSRNYSRKNRTQGCYVVCYFRTSHEKSLMRWVCKLKKKTKYLKTRHNRYYKSAESVRMPASKFSSTRSTGYIVPSHVGGSYKQTI